MLTEQGGAAHQQPGAVEFGAHAHAQDDLARLVDGHVDVLVLGVGDDRLRQRMPGVQFAGGRQAQDLVGGEPVAERHHTRHQRPAEGEGAGLVEDDGRDAAGALQVGAALDEGAAPRAVADRRADRGGRGQSGRAGQAISSMVIARRGSRVTAYVSAASPNETGTKRRVKRLATVWIGARSDWASSTRAMMRPTVVSRPTSSARTVSEPEVTIVPA